MPKCPVCGKPIEFGCMWDPGSLMEDTQLIHEECFEQYMNEKYGVGKWMVVDDDGCDGYYVWTDEPGASCDHYTGDTIWYGTGIFYTELEESELKEMED